MKLYYLNKENSKDSTQAMSMYLRLGKLVRSGLKYLKITPITPLLETTTSAETLGVRSIESSAMFRRKKGNSVKLELVVEYFKTGALVHKLFFRLCRSPGYQV